MSEQAASGNAENGPEALNQGLSGDAAGAVQADDGSAVAAAKSAGKKAKKRRRGERELVMRSGAAPKDGSCRLCGIGPQLAARLWDAWDPRDVERGWTAVVQRICGEEGIELEPEMIRDHFSNHKPEQPELLGIMDRQLRVEDAKALPERMQGIIRGVYRQRMLLHRQVKEIYYMGELTPAAAKESAKNEMRQLAQAHYLYRYYPIDSDKKLRGAKKLNRFTTSMIWFLGRGALPFLIQDQNLLDEPSYIGRASDVAKETLMHDLQANEVAVKLAEHLRKSDGAPSYLGDITAAFVRENWYGPGPAMLAMGYWDKTLHRHVRLQPDGFGSIALHGDNLRPTQLPFFYEFDHGSRETADVAQQLLNYHGLGRSGAAAKRFPDLAVDGYAPPVLMIFSDGRRLLGVMKQFRKLWEQRYGGEAPGAPIMLAQDNHWRKNSLAADIGLDPWAPADSNRVSFMDFLLKSGKQLIEHAPLGARQVLELDPKGAPYKLEGWDPRTKQNTKPKASTGQKKSQTAASGDAAGDAAGAALRQPTSDPASDHGGGEQPQTQAGERNVTASDRRSEGEGADGEQSPHESIAVAENVMEEADAAGADDREHSGSRASVEEMGEGPGQASQGQEGNAPAEAGDEEAAPPLDAADSGSEDEVPAEVRERFEQLRNAAGFDPFAISPPPSEKQPPAHSDGGREEIDSSSAEKEEALEKEGQDAAAGEREQADKPDVESERDEQEAAAEDTVGEDTVGEEDTRPAGAEATGWNPFAAPQGSDERAESGVTELESDSSHAATEAAADTEPEAAAEPDAESEQPIPGFDLFAPRDETRERAAGERPEDAQTEAAADADTANREESDLIPGFSFAAAAEHDHDERGEAGGGPGAIGHQADVEAPGLGEAPPGAEPEPAVDPEPAAQLPPEPAEAQDRTPRRQGAPSQTALAGGGPAYRNPQSSFPDLEEELDGSSPAPQPAPEAEHGRQGTQSSDDELPEALRPVGAAAEYSVEIEEPERPERAGGELPLSDPQIGQRPAGPAPIADHPTQPHKPAAAEPDPAPGAPAPAQPRTEEQRERMPAGADQPAAPQQATPPQRSMPRPAPAAPQPTPAPTPRPAPAPQPPVPASRPAPAPTQPPVPRQPAPAPQPPVPAPPAPGTTADQVSQEAAALRRARRRARQSFDD